MRKVTLVNAYSPFGNLTNTKHIWIPDFHDYSYNPEWMHRAKSEYSFEFAGFMDGLDRTTVRQCPFIPSGYVKVI